MNKKRILKLADDLEADEGFHFSMADSCTCLTGYARHRHGTTLREHIQMPDGSEYGLLIMPPRWSNRDNYPRDAAVRTLRHLAKTGKVDWSISAA